ncbi:hypothetical protein [uncultured Vibrio sp.]|uniref:hypothetical protein n=1 Tax=uncultured Vibrio sp. TaxID=114054 RepID=UPI002625C525|nr:hypothetical protein [uncultured Vibrio sp.]
MKLFVNVSVVLYPFLFFVTSVNASVSTDEVSFSGRVGGDIRAVYSHKSLTSVGGVKIAQVAEGVAQNSHVTLLSNEMGDVIVREVDM